MQFVEMIGDWGKYYIECDEKGWLMVYGFMIVSIGIKIGGDLNYIVREMVSEFFCLVFVGDIVICECILIEVEKVDGF